MAAEKFSSLDMKAILHNRLIDMHFQSIVSLKKKSIIGVEALCRTTTPAGMPVPPNVLFSQAEQVGATVALDRLCREKAVEKFSPLAQHNPDLLLFVNIDSAIIDQGVVGSGHMLSTVMASAIDPTRVVIEINESQICDVAALRRFVHIHKEYGFLIAIDDIGYGHSNLDRIAHVKPDIMKVDRWLCSGIEEDYYKQEVFTALVGLARRIGSLVVAEGVETKEEALTVLGLGADMIQGYYFAKPRKLSGPLLFQHDAIVVKFRDRRVAAISQDMHRSRSFSTAMGQLVSQMSVKRSGEYEECLYQYCQQCSLIEYAYILNWEGKQIIDTVGCREASQSNNPIFRAATQGTDQSLKDYYLYIRAGLEEYITAPYMSLATGKICVTCSAIIRGADGDRYILCADFSPALLG